MNKVLPFRTTQEVKELESPEWLIENILPNGVIAMLYGEENSHKTFITIDMALSVASGNQYHGRAVAQGAVIYVAAEGGSPIRKRIEAWEKEANVTIENCDWLLEPFVLDDPDSAQRLLASICNRGSEPKLVIFDTLNWCMQGEENAAPAMGAVLRTLKQLTTELGCTALVVHHTPKGNDRTHRGSGALSAGVATNLNVEYNGNVTVLNCIKQKDAERFEPIVFKHCKVKDSLVMHEIKTSAGKTVLGAVDAKQVILNLVKDERLTKKQLVAKAIEWGVPESTAYSKITKLVEYKELRVNEQGYLVVA